ncbi:hypothetical protein OHC33_003084 [Knufia fluminis]|uniref:Uncharacterized protein n=1 Tax=Knufia fluminis TaxID=191047 RepID=A0AAN8I990_9EURO|nr:hypothetical protein OHC33_003084 [Knufia fluminis]
MESENNSLLNVPITDEERRQRQRSRSGSGSSRTLVNTPQSSQHERDRQFTPQIGRFSSLRRPEERYDDPDQHDDQNGDHLYAAGNRTRSSTLPGIDEESHYSDHDEEEPINPPVRSTTFPKTNAAAYQPVRSAPDPHEQPLAPIVTPHFWQPIWLGKLSLTLMTVLLLALIAGLIAVCVGADSHGGYHISSSVEHYAWTYVPTIVFVVLAALWRQIDFHTKSLMPWKELSLGPLSPFETVLVDYISGFQILAFFAAFKRLHRAVMVTILAFFIAKALTIASTGIFIVRSATFTDGFPTLINSAFDAAALDPSILNIDTFPNSSVYTYSQNVVNGLGPQLGIASGYAYLLPTLASSSKAVTANSTFNATVDTFVPLINCRAANVTLDGEATIETTDFPYNSTETPYGAPSNITLSINENDICSSWPQLSFAGLDPLHYIVPDRQLESRSEMVICQDTSDADPILLLTLVEVSYSQTLLTNVTRQEGGDLPIALDTQRSVSRMMNVLCQADYTISQVNITNNTAMNGLGAITTTPVERVNNRTLDGLSSANMTTIYSIMLGANTGLFTAVPDANFIRSPAFDLLTFTADGSYDDMFDGDRLSNAATQTYLGTIPAFAHENLVLTRSNDDAPSGPVASITWTEDRLYTNWTPVILVVTGLGIMALLTVALILFMPENVVPRDPNSIAAAATTLSRSSELNRLLRKLQSARNKGIAAALNGYEVGTAIAVDESDGSRGFKIHVTEGKPQRDVQEIAPDLRFWNPIWASIPVMAASFCIPLIFIAILQVLQDRSDKNNGLMGVPDNKGTIIGSHYVPAFVTLLIAAIISNLDFYIKLFSPWAKLYKTRASAQHSILTNVLGHSPPSAIINAVRSRYYGAILSTVAAILASLLTVIISGLYVVEHFETDGPARGLSPSDSFNTSLVSAYSVDNDNGAGAMLNLIQHNSSYPAFTSGEYAFQKASLLELQEPVKYGSMLVGGMRGTLQALRGNLSCEAPTSYDVSTVDSVVRVSASYDVPESCRNGIGSELDSPTITFSTDFSPAERSTDFGGKQFDLRFGTNSSLYGHLGEENSSLVADNPPVGCPSLAFVWGNFELENDNQSAVNVAVCYQNIQTVNINVTFQQNTTELDLRYHIPPPEESTIHSQDNPNGTTKVFDFRIENNLKRQLGTYLTQDTPNVDPFFQSMINGSIQMDLEKFMHNRSWALMGISHTYGLYMAQVINAMMRQPLDSASDRLVARQQSAVTDLRTTITTPRLVQDSTSKNILHALLALSAIFILAGYILTKTRNVLPCNPTSIAGTMSLLAGSDLVYSPDTGVCECCGKVRRSIRSADGRMVRMETIHADDNELADERVQLIRPGAEWMDDKTFARVFDGYTFSLGWWAANPKKGQTHKRYGVDYGDGPTGNEESDWYLGKRKNSETFEIFSEQVNEAEGRGRRRALSDVNERGAYQRAEPSPGIEAHEMRDLAPQRSLGAQGRYGDG